MGNNLENYDLIQLENTVWLLEKKTNSPVYDFPFDTSFACRRPWERPCDIQAIARVGAPSQYSALYSELATENIFLINSPEQHLNDSELPFWYPHIQELTPKSAWFDIPPESNVVAELFEWPVFVKGARQTSRHDPKKSIASNPVEYEKLIEAYRGDAILGWQQCVVREFVKLRPITCDEHVKIQPSFEFRTFWWHKQLVGFGPYWSQFANYQASNAERADSIKVAQETATKIDCPFLVVDMAQTIAGQWIVIECNDAQESGYAGVSPFEIWNKILQIEKTKQIKDNVK